MMGMEDGYWSTSPALAMLCLTLTGIPVSGQNWHHPIYVMDLLRNQQGLQQMLPLTPGIRRSCVTGNNGHSSGMVAGRWTLRKSTQTSALISTMAGLLWINITLLLSQKVHGMILAIKTVRATSTAAGLMAIEDLTIYVQSTQT